MHRPEELHAVPDPQLRSGAPQQFLNLLRDATVPVVRSSSGMRFRARSSA